MSALYSSSVFSSFYKEAWEDFKSWPFYRVRLSYVANRNTVWTNMEWSFLFSWILLGINLFFNNPKWLTPILLLFFCVLLVSFLAFFFLPFSSIFSFSFFSFFSFFLYFAWGFHHWLLLPRWAVRRALQSNSLSPRRFKLERYASELT